jgi:two-component system response regulator AlgR
MKILIADDEALARTRLSELVTEIGGHTLVGEADTGLQTVLMANDLRPEIILMDIRMPGMDGLEAARHIAGSDNPPAVIFTTAFGEHALAAFEAEAVDYLLKPVRKERLATALGRAQRLTHGQLAKLHMRSDPAARTHISAIRHGNIQVVPVSDILYFKAEQKYVTVSFPGGCVLIEDSLKTLEEEFGEVFIRIHRNTLVAKAHIAGIQKISGDTYYITLRGSTETLEISRRHLSLTRQALKYVVLT